MSDTGITDNSVGGNVTNSGAPTGASTAQSGASATATSENFGPSVGTANNIESTGEGAGGEQKSGVKGFVSKIADKMNPHHGTTDTSATGPGPQHAGTTSGDPTREKQTHVDLNRE